MAVPLSFCGVVAGAIFFFFLLFLGAEALSWLFVFLLVGGVGALGWRLLLGGFCSYLRFGCPFGLMSCWLLLWLPCLVGGFCFVLVCSGARLWG